MQLENSNPNGYLLEVSILTRPGGRVQHIGSYVLELWLKVSILTRPGGRVQRRNASYAVEFHSVSILTRPGGRVQPYHRWATKSVDCFNPHPSRRTGATGDALRHLSHALQRFNPHPSRRTGATSFTGQSTSPRLVSILTRPGGRVQHNGVRYNSRAGRVSILTRPGGRVQLPMSAQMREQFSVSILTRPGGRVQLVPELRIQPPSIGFNPHPSRRTGATDRPRRASQVQQVSILTRPGGRVQPPATR